MSARAARADVVRVAGSVARVVGPRITMTYPEFVLALRAGTLAVYRTSSRAWPPHACPACEGWNASGIVVWHKRRHRCPACVPHRRQCARCRRMRPVETFDVPGGQRVDSYCGDCRRTRHNDYYHAMQRAGRKVPPAEPPLSGIVEADETFFRRNFKRLKPVGRRKRKRGTAAGNPRGLGKDKVPVLIARSRSGETRAAVLPGTATREALATALCGMVDPASTLCTDGSDALRAAAQEVGVRKHVALVAARGERKRGIYHVQSVNSYQGRLKQWLAPFRGVATKYLHRYLAWHVIHERVSRLSPRTARRVLDGNSAELAAARCCPNCGAALAA